jgi:putative membrane protein
VPSGVPGWWEAFTLYVRGALIGTADVVPGVSGGTIALIVGVYERLILGLSYLFRVPVALVRSGWRTGWEGFVKVPWFFLTFLGLGVFTAFVVGANVIPPLYERFALQMNALFFGLILGSVAVPWHRIESPGRKHLLVAAVAAIIAFALVGIPQRETAEPSMLLVGGAAMVAVSAMVLPGVSGAYLLHVFGVWVPTMEAVRSVDVGYLGVFAAGALVGAVVIVAAVSWLLKAHHDVTLAALVGLMLGALRALWPWADEAGALVLPEWELGVLLAPVLLAVGGFVFVRLIDHWGRRHLSGERIGPGAEGEGDHDEVS